MRKRYLCITVLTHNKHSFEVGSEVIQNDANNLTFLQLSTSTLPLYYDKSDSITSRRSFKCDSNSGLNQLAVN